MWKQQRGSKKKNSVIIGDLDIEVHETAIGDLQKVRRTRENIR